jgi:uncharacterized membrane protein YbjE (DUF340 family)
MWLLLATSILPILTALGLGWGLAAYLKKSVKQWLVALITPLVWALLWVIGYQFAAILTDPHLGLLLFKQALVYASLISIISFGLLCYPTESATMTFGHWADLWPAIKACAIAILWVVFGCVSYQVSAVHYALGAWSSGLLYVLVALVGVDLSQVRLRQMSRIYLLLPLVIVLGLVLAALLSSYILKRSVLELLLVGSGLGWFSLAGSLVGTLVGPELGSLAFLTNLMREFYAIIFLYFFGRRYAYGSIAVCAATAMDSTLPFVKSNCSAQQVQLAIYVGFVMTLIAPLLILGLASCF